ncbi:hypothetical protein PN836_000305 [Ningiella sp. W23]|uniref:hypothetical protein n=1 Tax=Ningiella sp. W23 TaxID=3023715 RepID=UPI0037568F87
MAIFNKSCAFKAFKPACLVFLSGLFSAQLQAAPIVFSDVSSNANFGDTISAFQAALGDPNNGNAPGPFSEGRRQINWDAGIVPFDMPADFFNNPAFPPTRGAVFSNSNDNEFRVSNDGIDNEFDTFNADNPDQFETFSAPRLFTPVGTNSFDVNFFIPADSTPATVSGFGAIFSDVDIFGSTVVDLFDINDNLLSSHTVETNSEGLSFLGVFFDDLIAPIFRVNITAGNTDIGLGLADDTAAGIDLVVLDDLFYSEPQAAVVSAPTTIALLSASLLLLISRRKTKSNAF